jgi:prephenate dehydratase
MAMKLGFLGPEGTFSEQAAIKYCAEAELVPKASIQEVADAVESGDVDEGIVPIENSLFGSIIPVLDFLIEAEKSRIKFELAIPVEQCLISEPDRDLKKVTRIYSHPQALGQCRAYLARNFPGVDLVAALSTAGSVADMLLSEEPAAAIAPYRAAEIHHATVVERGIEDGKSNFTRFAVLGHSDHRPTGHDKTSLAFWFSSDAPGTLYQALGLFSNRGINLSKIESRPTGESLGTYVFLADISGHRHDNSVSAALSDLAKITSELKILGSYPQMPDTAGAPTGQ